LRASVQRPGDLAAETLGDSRAREGDEADLAALARLEAHGGAGGNGEAIAARPATVEDERRVGLEEMIMGSRPGSAGRRYWPRSEESFLGRH